MSALHPVRTHEHHAPRGIDALNYPEFTESGERTDEYIVHTKQGFISPEEELDHSGTPNASSASSAVNTAVDDREKGLDIKLVTWKDDDPEDPRNWSYSYKWVQTLIVSFSCLAVALGSSLVVMDFDTVARALHTSLDVVHLTVALFVLGFALGPLAFAPLSEIIGRRPVFILSMGLYFALCFPSAFAQNAYALVIGRALAGLAASAPITVIGGSLSDLWSADDRGLPIAIFSGTLFVGPTMGPLFAGYLSAVGWRWNYYLMIWIVALSLASIVLFMPETYAVVLLRKRAEKLRKETGDMGYMTEQERHRRPLAEIISVSLLRPMTILFTESIVFLFTLYLSLIYSLLYLLFFAVPIVWGEIHGFPLGSQGLAFLPILIGMALVFATILPWQARYYSRVSEECKLKGEPVPPEARLPAMMIGCVLLPIGLFIFAWTSYKNVHWIAPMFGTGLFGFAMIAIYTSANSYLIDSFPTEAASTLAAKTLISRLCGASIPMFTDRFYHSKLNAPGASAILAAISLCMLPIPFIFFKYGAGIRASSKRSVV